MNTIDVIGVGLGYADITEKHHAIIARAEVLVGGKRHLKWFPAHAGEKREITAPLEDVIGDIRDWMKYRQVAVLASGDPLFHGIGETLVATLGNERVVVHPNVSVMAAAFARIGRTWKDAAAVSMHGRDDDSALRAAVAENRPVFVFTDGRNTPARVAETAFAHAGFPLQMCVLERLGENNERIRWMDSAEGAAGVSFAAPNAMILLPVGDVKTPGERSRTETAAPPPGHPDGRFAHDADMITRAEIRAVSIAALRLAPHHVLWDLGAGSGSVGIEAAKALTRGRVAAVEKKPERVENIRTNICRFGARNVDVFQKTLPAGIDGLPPPDRVFIGGGGKDLPGIIRKSAPRLPAGGRMVVNAVVLETVAAALAEIRRLGMAYDVRCVQVSAGAGMPAGIRLRAGNPVFVISAETPGEMARPSGDARGRERFPVRFVGAGPGDPDLLTIKAQKALQSADRIIYAGSLVPEAVLAWAAPDAVLKSSAGMHLEEMVSDMAEARAAGQRVVRLHSGDPSLFGAISEQMNALDQKSIPYDVIPGVTSAFAAAAALKTEFTVPEKTQTLIFTRAEGRTPVPEAEKLAHLAAHGAAMAVYLSAGLAENVAAALISAYGPGSPVAVVYRASRPDEKVLRTTAENLVQTMADHDIRQTALILAGPGLSENRGLTAASKLYDKDFTHGCRKKST